MKEIKNVFFIYNDKRESILLLPHGLKITEIQSIEYSFNNKQLYLIKNNKEKFFINLKESINKQFNLSKYKLFMDMINKEKELRIISIFKEKNYKKEKNEK